MRILTTADATETAPYERTRMYSEPISPTDTDENGNAVSIDNSGQFRVTINGKNNVVKIANRTAGARVVVNIQGNNNTIEIGKCALRDFSIHIGSHQPVSGAKIRIGDHFSIEPGGAFEVLTDFAEVRIAEHCMFSRDIKIHFGDNPHLIFDKATGEYKDGDGLIEIGRKVWVGEGCYLSKRARIGPAPVLFRSFESDTRHQGDRIWQQYTAMSSSVMQFASRSPVA